MSASRRDVLISGGVIGAGLVGADFSILSALAGPTPPLRRDLATLSMTDPIVETYRDAVTIMQGKPAGDKFNWKNLCYIHGNETGYHFCPHGDWYFLPWHRAYVVTYEKAIRTLTGNKDFAFPYWNWFDNPVMPVQFTTPMVNGKANPLYVATRTWPANQPMPNNIVGASVQTQVMTATPYELFGTTRNPMQNSLDQSWVPAGGGFQGKLEQTPHNQIHNNIGGWMPTAMSPMDPIFFMHHANIDRIWAVWNHNGNANSSDPLWTGMTFQDNFLNPDGTSWSPKVSDLYVPENLGYTYGLGVPLATVAKNLVLIENEFIRLMKYLKNPGGPVEGVKVFEASAATTAATHLTLPVKVDASLVTTIRASKRPAPAVNRLRQEAEAGPQVLALLSNVMATNPENAQFRVFLNARSPTPDTPVSDPHYVGSFAIFAHHMAAGGQHKMPSFAVDLTDAVHRIGNGGDLSVQIVPVPIRKDAPAGTVTVERVQVAFLTP